MLSKILWQTCCKHFTDVSFTICYHWLVLCLAAVKRLRYFLFIPISKRLECFYSNSRKDEMMNVFIDQQTITDQNDAARLCGSSIFTTRYSSNALDCAPCG